uniref:Uncharacterized protein n=1 Tax=Attheya septentrionalis TaxID=420275 RepID=A0A7S2UNA2_9STRA|mmetsp:Transcript_29499/g.54059  ORF Transcript_29499/g.54059 Transcript_29499/m.54059 type:complete len:127 (+) Transcript_29499:1924-2304(+)|eukprot:CAMPEP_0198293614 /NCGR_PEP_ID=MMETSP1449-20131203/18021_1 /TAXON_ID=420275 /ORGANISM="Attheya septentrionalis, Strain CCMP2084" /LENGTH=126 /DNA_ID=CAMNT_0043993259 /DNA_START=1847 /DNA_END=2227 /DNA_ORIENTATION=-
MSFGSKRTIVRVNDMIAQVKAATGETEMFYSKNSSEPLIDMVCRVSDGFEATQVTIRVQHDAEAAKIQALVNSLDMKETEHLTIIYAVPRSRYNDFVTDPVNPLLNQPALARRVTIYHVAIDDDEQ